jgi:hypothetical protein
LQKPSELLCLAPIFNPAVMNRWKVEGKQRIAGQAEGLRGSRGRAPMDDLVVDCLRGDRNARLVVTGGDLLNEINDAAAKI